LRRAAHNLPPYDEQKTVIAQAVPGGNGGSFLGPTTIVARYVPVAFKNLGRVHKSVKQQNRIKSGARTDYSANSVYLRWEIFIAA
jgi:hypothetical protein